jgi:Aspartyl protease
MRLLLATAIPVSLALSSLAQTMTPMNEAAGLQIVQVSMNGTGPYAFILDTGANTTMVSGQLLRKLNVLTEEPVTIAASLGETHPRRAELGFLAIGDLRVDHIEINTLEDGQLGILEGRAQGILGENFLKHFDLLIDNDRHELILDSTPDLARSLAGERLPLSSSGRFNTALTLDRLVVSLKAPSLLQRSMLFLVDSGTNTAMVYPFKNETLKVGRGSAHGSIHSLNKNQVCQVGRTPLTIGNRTYRDVVMAICENMTRDKMDTDGLLPTSLFRRLFISHREQYAIANPQPASIVDDDRSTRPASTISK